MFRQPLLPCACLALTLGVAGLVLPPPAWGQDRTTQERLDRLERDLNMLQRQVYRGAPPPPMAGGSDVAVNTEVRMGRLEAEMRDLTGRVEEFTNQIQQVKQRIEQMKSDIEVRFNQQGDGPGPVAGAAPPFAPPDKPAFERPRASRQFAAGPPPPGDPDEELTPPRDLLGRGPGALRPPGSPEFGPPGEPPPSGPTPIFGTLRPPGSPPAPADMANAAPPVHPPARSEAAGSVLPQGSAAEQYNFAFGLLKQADYPAAEAALKAFVEQHPKDGMAGNAQYWLGETYYARNKYMEAAAAFAEGYKRYPKGPKAADDLLKLGMSLARANQKQNACLALAQLEHDFPNAGASVKQRSAAEKKHLGCS